MTERAAYVRTLAGHTSPETAFTRDGYPYGRHRTQVRYWLEHHPRHGFRAVFQSLNPKTGRWNAPKRGTYAPVLVLTLDANGHVQNEGLGIYRGEEEIAAYEARHAAALTPEHRARIAYLRALNARAARVSYTVKAAGFATIDGNGITEHATQEEADAYRASAA